MVQFISLPESTRSRESRAAATSAGNALGQYFGHNQRQNQTAQSIEGVKQIFSNPNLSMEQKQIGLYEALKNNPEMAKSLGDQLLKGQNQGQTQQILGNIFGTSQQPFQEQLQQQQAPQQQQRQQMPQQQMQQPKPQMQQSRAGFNPATIPDSEIAQLTAVNPNLGKVVQQQKDVALREQREQDKESRREQEFNQKRQFELEDLARKEENEISKPILLELNQVRKNIPLQEQAIEDIKKAAPNVNARDYIADLTGFEPLRTQEGAKLKTAIKEFFLSDLTRAGARPNQWIEQQLSDALPKIGRSPEANLIVAEGMQFKVDLAKKRIETIDDLAEKDREKLGFVRGDIDSRAYKEMAPYIRERQIELRNSIEQVQKEYSKKNTPNKAEKGFIRMQDPNTGERWDIPIQDVGEARKAEWIEV